MLIRVDLGSPMDEEPRRTMSQIQATELGMKEFIPERRA